MSLNQELIEQKKALRLDMKARRAALSEAERATASAALCQRLLEWLETRPERNIGVYLATPHEISLDGLIPELLLRGYQLAAPRIFLTTSRPRMVFAPLDSLETVEIGPRLLRQPVPSRVEPDIELFLVPGLAFDAQGGRLGMGGGYYDRFLKDDTPRVGVGYDFQIVPQVPLEAHDERMHYVASESSWLETAR